MSDIWRGALIDGLAPLPPFRGGPFEASPRDTGPAELIVGGDFSDPGAATPVNAAISGGQGRLGTNGTGAGSITFPVDMVAGTAYTVSYDIVSVGGTSGGVRADSGASFVQTYSTTIGTRTEEITPSTTISDIRLLSQGAGEVVVDNLSVMEA